MENQDQFINQLGAQFNTENPESEEPIVADPAGGTDPVANTETDSDTPIVEAPKANENETQDSNPMRMLRNQYNETKQENEKQKKLLERLAAQRGTTLEELESKLQEEEDKKNAASKGISPEIQAQLRHNEARIKQLEQERAKENFNYRVSQFVTKNPMSNEDLQAFAQQAGQAGFDILNQNVDLSALYRALNYDKIIANERNTVRQQVLEELKIKQKQSPVVNTIPSLAGDTGNKATSTDQDFIKDLFSSFGK